MRRSQQLPGHESAVVHILPRRSSTRPSVHHFDISVGTARSDSARWETSTFSRYLIGRDCQYDRCLKVHKRDMSGQPVYSLIWKRFQSRIQQDGHVAEAADDFRELGCSCQSSAVALAYSKSRSKAPEIALKRACPPKLWPTVSRPMNAVLESPLFRSM